MAPEAREIALPGSPADWSAAGFAVGAGGTFAVGGVRLSTGAERLAVGATGLAAERPDGLPIAASAPGADPAAGGHPNGAVAIDHVVALTDAHARSIAALEAAGFELRRLREPPEAPASQAFFRFGPLILELVEAPGEPRLWGLVAVVADLDACAALLGDALGAPRPAVQPGRRIATVRGTPVPLALMTPRPQPARPG